MEYHSLADAYDALVVARAPALDAARHDVVRRFVALVDVFYDRGRALVVDAAAPIDALLLVDGRPARVARLSPNAAAGAADTLFAWARTTSRLVEMATAPAYRARWRARRRPPGDAA